MAKKKIIVSCKIIKVDLIKVELKGQDCQYLDEKSVLHHIGGVEVGHR